MRDKSQCLNLLSDPSLVHLTFNLRSTYRFQNINTTMNALKDLENWFESILLLQYLKYIEVHDH